MERKRSQRIIFVVQTVFSEPKESTVLLECRLGIGNKEFHVHMCVHTRI